MRVELVALFVLPRILAQRGMRTFCRNGHFGQLDNDYKRVIFRKTVSHIYKHKQSNNPHRASRRERPTGWAARAVHPKAKTPAVQILSISNVPSDILNAIDELAARQDRSRSSFIRRHLQRIIAAYRAEAAY